jgi:hypothetical protein
MSSFKGKTYWANYFSTKKGHLKSYRNAAMQRARLKNIPFNLTIKYIESIATDECPIFKMPFVWGRSGRGHGKSRGPYAPSLDRVIPELGYVEGNVVFISHWANKIKQDVTEKELYAVADWLHDKRKEVLNAFKEQPTPVPRPPDTPGRKGPAHGAVHGARAGKDCDGSQHHQGEFFGADTGHCA